MRASPVRPAPFDRIGQPTDKLATGGLTFGAIEVPEAGFTAPPVLVALDMAVVALAAFVALELMSPYGDKIALPEGRRWWEARMDLDAVVDELYRLAPGDFTAVRDERARTARADGDREPAERIRRLRRPTLAAWASNLLVREQPEETERLLRLGAALRQAHRNPDGDQLRELSAQQHQLTFALARQAAQLAAETGLRISDDVRQEVQDTLHAVLADPPTAAQWAKGQLTKPLSLPAGFPTPLRRPEEAPAPRRRIRPAKEVADPDAARARRQERQARLDQARQRAADAERELHAREDELAAAEEEKIPIMPTTLSFWRQLAENH
ncbi:hypothetical protein ABZ646_43320 [Streptomyces sp. NPDC007162]|uniref:hypothetical protein n=1 Tax=Streptomyces sp. NPDC007162 TaxID=3156917 RepID=UPI0033C10072